MDTHKDSNHCQHCGRALDAKSIQGLCPACLLQAGWPTSEQTGSDDQHPPFVPPSREALQALFPQLEIGKLIGRGGMGAVYKARQRDLDRTVALKILGKKSDLDPGFDERFTREARALARLSHPNIVAVHDYGQAGDLSYFIMEYVDGPNLREIQKSGDLTPKEALEIVPQICTALQYAHDEGIVHRDIKPENILLDRKGRVKIADFGLAKLLGQGCSNFTLTQAGLVMGTPHYMAPEQVEHPQDVDHRADIYSLGVVFYEMLTGELPMGKFQPPSRKVQIDVRLDEVVLRTLAKEPELRYQQVSQVQTEVQTIVAQGDSSQHTTNARSYNPWEPIIVYAGTVFFVVLFVLGADASRPFVLPLILLSIIGMSICILSWIGRWPFPSPLFPEPNFSSRNLRRNKGSGSPKQNVVPRLSLAATLGFAWIGLFFLNWIVSYTPPGWALTSACRRGPLNLVTELFLFLPLALLGFGAVVGGSIMGGLALQQIRKSRGMVRGFGLALFDLLFFPLALLNHWMIWLVHRVLEQTDMTHKAVIVISILGGVGLNVWLILFCKRVATRFVQRPAPPSPSQPIGSWPQVFKKTALRLLAVIVVNLALTETLFQVSLHWKESTSEQWDIALAVATLGALIWACWPGYRLKRSRLYWIFSTGLSALIVLGLANFYSWHLRPNLGLYHEPDWVAQHPAFQQKQQEAIARRLWASKITVTNTGTDMVEVRTTNTKRKVILGQNGVSQFSRKAQVLIGDALIRVGKRMEVINQGSDVISITSLEESKLYTTQLGQGGTGYFSLLTPIRMGDIIIQFRQNQQSVAMGTSTNTNPSTPVDFNDPNFWQAQIIKHLEGVRTLDCELITEQQNFGEDQNEPKEAYRTRFKLKWDRDHQWIDCAAEPIDRNGITERIVCGSKIGWINHGINNWTKVNADKNNVVIMQRFTELEQRRDHPYEHAFSIAQGIIYSDIIKDLQEKEGSLDWEATQFSHREEKQGYHVLTYTIPMLRRFENRTIHAECILVGTWEKEAFKLLEVRGGIPEFGINQLSEKLEDHLYAKGVWVPQQVTKWNWEGLDPDGQGGLTQMTLHKKTIITAQRMIVNQSMSAAMFDGFMPPLDDIIEDLATENDVQGTPDT